jgi:hypothetical protein
VTILVLKSSIELFTNCHSLGIRNIELLPKFISEVDVASPEAKVPLIIICSAATYIS